MSVSGRGFLPSPPLPGVNRTSALSNESNAAWPSGSPPFRLISASTTSMLLYVDRYLPTAADNASANDITIGWGYSVVPPDTAPDQYYRYPRGYFWWKFSRGLAPYVTSADTSACSLGSGCTASVSWGIAQGRSHGLGNLTAGAASNATFVLQSGSSTINCSNPVVQTSAVSGSSYNETVQCTLDAAVPAANYVLWVCLNTSKYGCGPKQDALVYAPTITSISPTSGSGGGGTTITISGSGETAF